MRIVVLAAAVILGGCASPPPIPPGADMKPPGDPGGYAGLTGIATLSATADSRTTLQGSALVDYEAFVHSVQRSVDEGAITPAEGRALVQRQRRQAEWRVRTAARSEYAYPDN